MKDIVTKINENTYPCDGVLEVCHKNLIFN